MEFNDRLAYLLLGMIIGWLLRLLVEEMMNKIEEVGSQMVKTITSRIPKRDQHGFMRVPWVANLSILLVVLLSLWASVVSQRASNTVEDQQDSQQQTVYCVRKTLSEALLALNERSIYAKKQIAANIQTQTDFSHFFNLLLREPPLTEKKQVAAALNYQKSLNHFVFISKKQKQKVANNEFPSTHDLYACLTKNNSWGESDGSK